MRPSWVTLCSVILLIAPGRCTEKNVSVYDKETISSIQPRIYGGNKTDIAELGGYVVQIYKNQKLICTGTLLTAKHLITAAHCFAGAAQEEFHVVAGLSDQPDLRSLPQLNTMTQIRQHPLYNKTGYKGDIAVAKLKYAVKRKRGVGYAKICSKKLGPHDTVTVSGWGKHSEEKVSASLHSKEPASLRSISVNMVQNPICQLLLDIKLPPNVLCTSTKKGRTICSGDSGAPLMYRKEVCGIATWTYECGNDRGADIYMSVRYYASFIKKSIKQMGKKKDV
ncbi:hypothetical protein KR018_011430 [Drosophila ironensis]|nr:hypothetical protein KR018_011430 [Drosophila ironensis]